MITVLRPVAAPSDPATRSPALFRVGLSSARRELQAGTARRHRAQALGSTEVGGGRVVADLDTAVDAPVESTTADLATQRAGVRAALAELRQHRGTA